MATQSALESTQQSNSETSEAAARQTAQSPGAGSSPAHPRTIPSVQDVSQDTLRHDDSEAETDTPKRQKPKPPRVNIAVAEEKKERLVTPTAVDSSKHGALMTDDEEDDS